MDFLAASRIANVALTELGVVLLLLVLVLVLLLGQTKPLVDIDVDQLLGYLVRLTSLCCLIIKNTFLRRTSSCAIHEITHQQLENGFNMLENRTERWIMKDGGYVESPNILNVFSKYLINYSSTQHLQIVSIMCTSKVIKVKSCTRTL